MATKTKIIVNYRAGVPNPTWAQFGVFTVDTFAEWLDSKYQQMIAWTGYDPTAIHGKQLVFERFQNDDYCYDPNSRRVNLASVNSQGQLWQQTLEFFAYCLHEMVHDFTRWDEPYCQQRIGIEALSYAQYCESLRKNEIDEVVESLCQYFKKRLLA